jgi:hypothetical protein
MNMRMIYFKKIVNSILVKKILFRIHKKGKMEIIQNEMVSCPKCNVVSTIMKAG